MCACVGGAATSIHVQTGSKASVGLAQARPNYRAYAFISGQQLVVYDNYFEKTRVAVEPPSMMGRTKEIVQGVKGFVCWRVLQVIEKKRKGEPHFLFCVQRLNLGLS